MKAAISAFVLVYLGTCSFFDIRTRQISRWILWLGALASLTLGLTGLKTGILAIPDVLGGLAVGLVSLVISVATGGKLGKGDAAVLCICCPLLGVLESATALLVAALAAAGVSVVCLAMRRLSLRQEIPFIPFLLLGMGVAVVN